MPATAGRVRMPANNRVHSSAALQTHGIWQSAIGYDPYAPEKDSSNKPRSSAAKGEVSDGDGGPENAYASFQGLLALARITGSNADDTRGACKRCGRVGHLTYQCRNFLSVKEDKDELALQNATEVFNKIKKANGMKKGEEESSEEEEEESESSDSDVDSEMERIIAERIGKKGNRNTGEEGSKEKRRGRSRRRRGRRLTHSSDDDDEEEDARKKQKKRKRHGSSDDDDSEEDRHHRRHRKNRKEKKRRHHGHRDVSDDESEEDSGRHGHHHRRRSSLRDVSESESEGSDRSDDGKPSDRQKEKHRDRNRSHDGRKPGRHGEKLKESNGSDDDNLCTGRRKIRQHQQRDESDDESEGGLDRHYRHHRRRSGLRGDISESESEGIVQSDDGQPSDRQKEKHRDRNVRKPGRHGEKHRVSSGSEDDDDSRTGRGKKRSEKRSRKH